MSEVLPLLFLQKLCTTQGSKDPKIRALGPKYHSDYSIWALIPHYLDPWTLRVIATKARSFGGCRTHKSSSNLCTRLLKSMAKTQNPRPLTPEALNPEALEPRALKPQAPIPQSPRPTSASSTPICMSWNPLKQIKKSSGRSLRGSVESSYNFNASSNRLTLNPELPRL